jgi:zinc protease
MLLLATVVMSQELPFERYELPNGLQVVLLVDHALPQVVVDVWYQVGSKDEQPGRSGFAHLFEHLMFMGTNRLPGNGIDMTMEGNGGWNNAWTMEDATNYYDVGPPNLLETLLWIEADRMEQLGQAMTQEKVDLQRDVVRNERRQSYEDTPYGVGWIEVPALMYPQGHPYAHSVIGTHEDLQAATLQDVKDFFATWYVPNNASLVVAGDFDPATVKPVIERYFGRLARKALPERLAAAPQDRPQKPRVEVTDQVQFPQVNLFFHTPGAYREGDAEVDLVGDLLASGESSRLYRRLVLGGLAQEVEAEQMPTAHGSLFMVSATAAEGVGVPELEAAIRAELTALGSTAPTAAEMERLKNQFEYTFLAGIEPVRERAELLNRYWAYTGSPDHLAADLARYRAVTPEGLRNAAATWLKPELAGVVVVLPEGAR